MEDVTTTETKKPDVEPTEGEVVVTTDAVQPAEQPNRTVVIRPGNEGSTLSSTSCSNCPSDDYSICGKIGEGGMGVVYLAKDRRLGRYVAIKRLNEKSLADTNLRARFLQEARAVAALNHAYIAHIYALGEDVLGPYIVMEYVAGPSSATESISSDATDRPPQKNLTLEQYIMRNGPMTSEEAVTMVLKVARTMVYAHASGVIHRDLKPGNILLDVTCEPKLIDFGLARLVPREGVTHVGDLTVPGEKLISLGYSAPELEQDASTSDGRADIYSLGAILYFLLTGRNPRYYREQEVPAYLREVMRRSLETVREQRYRNAQDFVTALSEAASHGKTVAPTIKTTWRCKWCDAVNPVTTKFCAECGWDGSEKCLECGGGTFVGQQYCPSCGADCRMYEHVASIMALMHEAWEARRFERLSTIAGRLHGFEPSGPSGRQMILEAHKLVEDGERKVARRNRLATLIPNELKAENYERAQNFIEEFQSLNEDPLIYSEELKNIPSLIFSRDLVRIRQCIRGRDWVTARHLTESLAAKYGDVPEYQDVRKIVMRHAQYKKRWMWVYTILGSVLLYLISMPWAVRLAGGHFEQHSLGWFLYRPAKTLFAFPGLHTLSSYYVEAITSNTIDDCYLSPEMIADAKRKHVLPLPGEIQIIHDNYLSAMERVRATYIAQRNSFLVRYIEALHNLRQLAQVEGDFECVVAVDKANKETTETSKISKDDPADPPAVLNEKQRYRQILEEQNLVSADRAVALTREYLAKLDKFKQAYTKDNQIQFAQSVSDEKERVLSNPYYAESIALVEKAKKSGKSLISTTGIAPAETERLNLQKERDAIIKEVAKITSDAQTALIDCPTQYKIALVNLIERYRQDGNFNAWEAASVELQRFEESSELRQTDIVQEPAELSELQKMFVNRKQEIILERDQKKVTLIKDHLAKLEKRKAQFTRDGRMDAAAAVDAEIRILRQDPVFQELLKANIPSAPSSPASAPKQPTSEGLTPTPTATATTEGDELQPVIPEA